MEARFLLDTNICIYIRRKKPDPVLRRFRTLKQGEAALSVITFGELVYGAEKSAQRTARGRKSRSLTAFGMTSGERGGAFFKSRLPRGARPAPGRGRVLGGAEGLPRARVPAAAGGGFGERC